MAVDSLASTGGFEELYSQLRQLSSILREEGNRSHPALTGVKVRELVEHHSEQTAALIRLLVRPP